MSEKTNSFNSRTCLILFAVACAYRAAHYFIFTDRIVAGSDMMQNQLLAAKFASGDFVGTLDAYWPPLYAVVVGVVTYFINDLIIPAVIVSIFAGSLAAPLTYVLTRQCYGEKSAVVAGCLGIFYPYLLNTTFELGTENIYLALVTASLIFGWWALERGHPHLYFFTGLISALAYLTRPEGIGYLFFFIFFIGLDYLRKKEWSAFRPTLLRVGALSLGFFLLASPYIFYLRQVTGVWTVSNKAAVNIAGGLLSPDGDRKTAEITTENVEGSKLVREFVVAGRLAQTYIQDLAPLLLFVFVSLGLFSENWSRQRLFRESYLITFCVLTTLGYIATIVLDRYFYVMLPVILAWMGHGIVQAEKWFSGSIGKWNSGRVRSLATKIFVPACLVVAFAYMFPLNFYIRSTKSAWQGSAFEERDAGLWIKENSEARPTIFSPGFRPVFYAEGTQFWTDATDGAEIMREIRASDVAYVIESDRATRHHPYLGELSSLLRSSNDFELVYQENRQNGFAISVFRRRARTGNDAVTSQ